MSAICGVPHGEAQHAVRAEMVLRAPLARAVIGPVVGTGAAVAWPRRRAVTQRTPGPRWREGGGRLTGQARTGRGLLRRCSDLGGPVGPEGAALALAALQASEQRSAVVAAAQTVLRFEAASLAGAHLHQLESLGSWGAPERRGVLAAVEGDVGGKDALGDGDTGGGSSEMRWMQGKSCVPLTC